MERTDRGDSKEFICLISSSVKDTKPLATDYHTGRFAAGPLDDHKRVAIGTSESENQTFS